MIHGLDSHNLTHLKYGEKRTGRISVSSLVITATLLIAFLTSILLTSQTGVLEIEQLLTPAICLTLLSAFSFISCGGATLNASSVTSLGILIFGGFAGIYASQDVDGHIVVDSVRGVLVGISLLFVFQLLVMSTSPRATEQPEFERASSNASSSHKPRIGVGVLAITLSIFDALMGGAYLAPLGFLGVLVLVDTALRSAKNKTRLAFSSILATVLMVFYYEVLFSGFGRLVLAVMASGVAILFSLYMSTKRFKFFVLLSSFVALPILSIQRLRFLEETRGSEPLESEGIGSVVGPLISFGRLVEARLSNDLDLSWGATFWDTVTLWIPRALWPSKPPGFGADIVEYTKPHLYGNEGYTDAAMVGGELVWNFGIIGAFISLLVFAYLINLLDKRIALMPSQADTFHNFLSRITLVVLAAALLHFIWGGTYTYLARIAVILIFLLCVRLLSIRSQRRVNAR